MIHLDYETSSLSDIFKVGGYRYANDPSTRILMFAISRDGGRVYVWSFNDPDSEESRTALAMFEEAIEDGELIYAHNASFEIAITRYRAERDLGLDILPTIDQWRCTQTMCRKAAIPPSLGQAGAFLRIEQPKAKVGKELIQVFSVQYKKTALQAPEHLRLYDRSTTGRKHPNRHSMSPIYGWFEDDDYYDEVLWDWKVKVDGEWITVLEAWDLFINYCRGDVIAEHQIHEKLASKFELTGPDLNSWQFNIRMNERGVPVNIPALRNAEKLIQQYQDLMHQRFYAITGLRPTQGIAFKAWLQDRGYHLDNMRGEEVDLFLADYDDMLTPEALKALRMHRLLNFAALAKIPAMLACACDDGRVRGTLIWHGARTGRATGSLIQVQNMKKATVETKQAYQMICDGDPLEDFVDMWSSPLEAIASCARHFIQQVGEEFLDADYVGVEARLAPWAVDDVRKLDSIMAGVDQYCVMASRVYEVDYDHIYDNRKKDTPEGRKAAKMRQVGKVAELACVYGVGGRGLRTGLAAPPNNIPMSFAETQKIVDVYRADHPATVKAWRDMSSAAVKAIKTGATATALQGWIKFGIVQTANTKFLVMRLPSGRRIYYPRAEAYRQFVHYTEEEMAENAFKREKKGWWTDGIKFYGALPMNRGWGEIRTWGSKFFENAIQAMGVDLLDYGCLQAEKAGYLIFMIIHDQALAHYSDLGIDYYKEVLCYRQKWARSFPLDADGAVVPYYLKD